MDRGYTLLWRKTWDNQILKENNKVFSKFEAWLYLVNVQARGIDSNGLLRGEMEVSYRYLAKAWRWDVAKTYRFIQALMGEKMVEDAPENDPEKVKHQVKHQMKHLKVCKYETYNPMRNDKRNTKRNKVKEGLKEGININTTTSEIFIEFPLKDGSNHPITKEQVEAWKEVFPAVDIEATLRIMKSWCVNNPSGRKTPRGANKFVDAWLRREQGKLQGQKALSVLTGTFGELK